MCGIVGQISDARIEPAVFDAMVDSLTARGPDGRGVTMFRNGRVGLGHRRLSIVDLSDRGRQPMTNETGDIWLTFNGEIYNHPTLRRQLETAGHCYRSESDSETILHAYEEWGVECVKRFRGIFAFGIWNDRDRELFCARDHLGVKPFYYSSTNTEFVFASQPRAILESSVANRRIEAQAFVDYLSYGIVPHDRAAFAGMSKLPPASRLVWKDGSYVVDRYWSVEYRPEIEDFDEAVEAVRSQLHESVRMQMMSDVPVATYLSGGIDSSLISAIAADASADRMTSLTIGFDEEVSDERPFARVAADHIGTEHIERVLTRDHAMEMIDDVVDAFDEPYALGAAFPMLYIAKLTQALGFKVVLAGDGADELFAGYLHYDDFEAIYDRQSPANRPAMGLIRRLSNWWRGESVDPVAAYFPREGVLPEPQLRKILHPTVSKSMSSDTRWRFRKFYNPNLQAVTAGQIIDLNSYLPGEILTKVDRATMACGVEARVPFLDPILVELAFSISADVNYRDGQRKAALKAAAAKFLPPTVLTSRKKGFSIPLVHWLLKDELRSQFLDEIEDGVLVQHELLTDVGLRQECMKLSSNYVWQLYAAELWARRWCSGSGVIR